MSKEIVVTLAEKALQFLSEGGQAPYTVISLYETDGRNAMRLLTQNGLINFRTDSNSITSNSIADITPRGEEAYRVGLSKYLTDLENRANEKADLEFKKLSIDVKNAERIHSTYWYTFGMSLIALLISATLLIIKLLEKP
ncbi:MAG: hypothetical protein V4520_02505 [Bacteroidota bacterium]